MQSQHISGNATICGKIWDMQIFAKYVIYAATDVICAATAVAAYITYFAKICVSHIFPHIVAFPDLRMCRLNKNRLLLCCYGVKSTWMIRMHFRAPTKCCGFSFLSPACNMLDLNWMKWSSQYHFLAFSSNLEIICMTVSLLTDVWITSVLSRVTLRTRDHHICYFVIFLHGVIFLGSSVNVFPVFHSCPRFYVLIQGGHKPGKPRILRFLWTWKIQGILRILCNLMEKL